MRLCLGPQKQRVPCLTTAVAQSRGLGQKCFKTLNFSAAFHLNPIVVILLVNTHTDEKKPTIGKACLIQ